ncbi:MAG: 3-deoxy-7-phosphoheptulonate synthase [Armatimonadetes bacterium CG2_30_59_28]|nr:3-deoxy-7-phosphoheptulonate synthase [Armatimonadota bacterium]OIO89551.1 MAG: 3-deoxy-7-phosphoheptulonate synthase [Armatimonadetes bacterium CG2_30_59_28]PIU60292.1 MAG: 3-deoxy-7-phosphoheptulonate synthase [Armatimonadetes bacterium CG07_land_8_20_14_0_80_59_28]PIY49377.1 MAG: 3-deoxy-7-phosphoheptulonate synthase [Armatimonadetes bacterium CG_4_10_14_3_um_filter_59_10]
MIIVLATGATDEQVEIIRRKLDDKGYSAHISRGIEKTVIGAIGITKPEDKELLADQVRALPFVERVVPIVKPYKLVSKESQPGPTTFHVGEVCVGSEQLTVMAGPCSVESREQIIGVAEMVKRAGANMLRGGAFKPRTSPYDFQGLQEEGLGYLKEAREATGLPTVTEILDPRDVELMHGYADVLQIGTRNMQNYTLLKEVGTCRIPVLLKRGMSATIEEWLKAAEYILANGNHHVMLCERGIRTFETYTRNTLDLSAIPAVKGLSHLPIIIDPSQGTGRREMVMAMSKAAIAAGADGLIIEVHPKPDEAMSDAQQQIEPGTLRQLIEELRPIAAAVGRVI